jgi:hypothetical protein
MLDGLSRSLARVVSNLATTAGDIGNPELVAAAAAESAEIFRAYGKTLPTGEHAHAAALAFMRSPSLNLDVRQIDLIAGVLADSVREAAGARPIGAPAFAKLLQALGDSARTGELPRLTWYGLLSSYFKYDPSARSATDHAGWKQLRSFLQNTWPIIDRESGTGIVPEWVTVIRGDPALITPTAAGSYAMGYLRGDDSAVKRLADDLAIPQSSWFWHALVLGAVSRATELDDAEFKEMIPRVLTLVQGKPVFRDQALIAILTRYHRCSDRPAHQALVNYVVQRDVWRNPKLKAAGIATSWNRVPEDVWRMVLGWVNERNLRDFFEILASRNDADEGRLAFWSQYLNQITWTRLVFGAKTRSLVSRNTAIRDLIAREEGAYATLTQGDDHDAFLMQLGEYIIVEFSKKPNAAYVYRASSLVFDRNAKYYAGTQEDLKKGFDGSCAARFTHMSDWATGAMYELKRLGIHPDPPGQRNRPGTLSNSPTSSAPRRQPGDTLAAPPVQSTSANRSGTTGTAPSTGPTLAPASSDAPKTAFLPDAPRGARFTMNILADVVQRFKGAFIDDKRRKEGGRLWVEDPQQDPRLEKLLVQLGFKWAQSRQAFYYPESP